MYVLFPKQYQSRFAIIKAVYNYFICFNLNSFVKHTRLKQFLNWITLNISWVYPTMIRSTKYPHKFMIWIETSYNVRNQNSVRIHEWCYTRSRISPPWAEGFADWPTMHNDSFAVTMTTCCNKRSLRRVSANNGAQFYRMFHNCETIGNIEVLTQFYRTIFPRNANPDAPASVQSKRMAWIFVVWSHCMQRHFALEQVWHYGLSQKSHWFSCNPTGRSREM